MAAILEDGFGSVLETATHGEARSGAVVAMPEHAPLRAVAGGRG
jgi:hypothetical protein